MTKNIGLRGVTVADTRISFIDGNQGILLYRGYSIQDLAENTSFEEVVFLLLMGRLPTAEETTATIKTLQKYRSLPPEAINYLKARKPEAKPMDVIQGAITVLADDDEGKDSDVRADVVTSALRLISRTGMILAAWHHIRQGHMPPKVDKTLTHAGAMLQQLWDRTPSPKEVKLMDTLLLLHAEHTFNASTFAAREVASTQAHMYAAVSAGVGALSGALHGSANARVMDMLEEIGDIDNVETWVRNRIESGQRVMGLGHAVYKIVDPRAIILADVARKVLSGTPEEQWFRLASKVDEVGRAALKEMRDLELYPNVDFFSGPILRAIGLPTDMFPGFFAAARVSGWTAHIIEERFAEAQPKPALYRPAANYVGRKCGPMGCKFIPMEQRGAGCPHGKDFPGCNEKQAFEDME